MIIVGAFNGDNSLAAVGSNTALIYLLVNLFSGIAVGANVCASKYFGARDDVSLQKTVHTTICLGLLTGIIITLAGLVFSEHILILMNTPTEILELSTTYLTIYFLGITATMVHGFGGALLRALGDTKKPMQFLIISGILNILLNLFFVAVCDMNVIGVSLSTVISQYLSAVLTLRYLSERTDGLKLIFSKIRLHKTYATEILQVGLPSGVQGVALSIANVYMQSAINTFGEIFVTANSISANIEGFISSILFAFNQTTISVVSQNFGAKKFDRIYRSIKINQLLVLGTGISLSIVVYLFGEVFLSIYSTNAYTIELAILLF